MRCQRCAGEQFVKAGRDRSGRQIYQCATCARRQTDRSTAAFRNYRFPDDIIALAVRWYPRFRLPYADIVELLAARGVRVDPSSVCDWVQRFTPLYKEAARRHRHRVGVRGAVDETSIRLAGRWVYAYRAIDEHGQVVDVYLSETRDTAAATAFFEQAIARTDVRPRRVTTDRAPTYPPALRAVVPEVEHITGKMEQHGHVVRRVSVAWSPDDVLLDTRTNRVFVRSTGGPGLLLDARTGAVVGTLALGPSVWNTRDGETVDRRTGRVYMLEAAARDNTGAAVGTGAVVVVDGHSGAFVRAIPVGLLPGDLALNERTGRLFVSEVNDAEYQRYGYRDRSTGAPDAWGWVPRPLRDWLPRAPRQQPAPSGSLNGTVRVIDTAR